MLVTCWAAKGGSGTTTVAAAVADVLARRADGEVVMVDAAGDLPAALGVADLDGPGVAEWLAAGPAVPADALARLEIAVRRGVRLVPRGRGALTNPWRAEVLAELLAADARPVVVDAGTLPGAGSEGAAADVARVLAGSATVSLLVTRPCYLALRRAASMPLRPSGVVLVDEPGRSLGVHDVEAILDVPVLANVPVDPAFARAVDSGSLGTRVPTRLSRALRHAA
ncbi:hypothetical protein [Rhabdothermincola salaria]|uniref:hypothetical protein n=1 Tax=Rhabdothermincola salaria TaxID=2903142 RepID=UPI001E413489|nr:hypothetical protein [Rhabdothermincola salaria]MCD9624624.1 hypothetical protein [Rhabdothermincola salaria]